MTTRVQMAPAWYVVRSQAPWARWFNVLHWPYSAWHLSYVALGAALAPTLDWALLGWSLLGFALGMGVAAHCFDLLQGDPLRLSLDRRHLLTAAVVSVALATAIGLSQVINGKVSPWLLLAIPLGIVLAAGYGLEWPGLHGHWQFPTWWALFPFTVSYFAQGITWSWALVPVGAFCFLTAYAQRVLSYRARMLRRRVTWAWGKVEITNARPGEGPVHDSPIPQDVDLRGWMLGPLDQALAFMSLAMPLVGVGLLLL